MHYIVVTRHADIWLVGPFISNDAAADYGATADRKMWSDPRWQTITLAHTFGLRVEAPEDTGVVPGAYDASCKAAA